MMYLPRLRRRLSSRRRRLEVKLDLLAPAATTPPPAAGAAGMWLSSSQRAHLRELARLLGRERVAVVGLDSAGQPTISRRDARGVATYSLHRDGRGVAPALPVVDFTDEVAERFEPSHWSYLMSFPATLKED